MTVLELEAGCAGDFKVVEPSDSDDVLLAGDGKWWAGGDRISIVKPDLLWCSCGVWQDFSPVPMHVRSSENGKRKSSSIFLWNWYICSTTHLSLCRAHSSKNIVFPVCLETIESLDCVTREPPAPKQQSRRPRTNRLFRQRKIVVELEETMFHLRQKRPQPKNLPF